MNFVKDYLAGLGNTLDELSLHQIERIKDILLNLPVSVAVYICFIREKYHVLVQNQEGISFHAHTFWKPLENTVIYTNNNEHENQKNNDLSSI